jgi:hypothetical protein
MLVHNRSVCKGIHIRSGISPATARTALQHSPPVSSLDLGKLTHIIPASAGRHAGGRLGNLSTMGPLKPVRALPGISALRQVMICRRYA